MIITDRTYALYIGADNVTHALRSDTLSTLAEVMAWEGIDGYSVDCLSGMWRGQAEESVRVTVSTDEGRARRMANSLASRLNQDSVGIVDIGPAMQFIGATIRLPEFATS